MPAVSRGENFNRCAFVLRPLDDVSGTSCTSELLFVVVSRACAGRVGFVVTTTDSTVYYIT